MSIINGCVGKTGDWQQVLELQSPIYNKCKKINKNRCWPKGPQEGIGMKSRGLLEFQEWQDLRHGPASELQTNLFPFNRLESTWVLRALTERKVKKKELTMLYEEDQENILCCFFYLAKQEN